MSLRVRHGRRILGLLVVPALVVSLAACSDDDASPAASPGATTTPSAPSPSGSSATPTPAGGKKTKGATPEPDPEAPGTAKPLPDPVVGKYTPIKRGGKIPKPTVTAAPAPFDEAVDYSDGLKLDITKVDHGKVTGQGPGVIAGAPTTSITLIMTNNSPKAVSLKGVVVTMLYGPDRRQARPIYDGDTARDFTGSLKPGASAKAVYIFSVPPAELDELTMYVDFDGIHTVAQFHGSLK